MKNRFLEAVAGTRDREQEQALHLMRPAAFNVYCRKCGKRVRQYSSRRRVICWNCSDNSKSAQFEGENNT